jgi:hypothetical protein
VDQLLTIAAAATILLANNLRKKASSEMIFFLSHSSFLLLPSLSLAYFFLKEQSNIDNKMNNWAQLPNEILKAIVDQLGRDFLEKQNGCLSISSGTKYIITKSITAKSL